MGEGGRGRGVFQTFKVKINGLYSIFYRAEDFKNSVNWINKARVSVEFDSCRVLVQNT